jgi:hypothetical protein
VELYKGTVRHTIQSSVVWLNVRRLNSTILDNKGVTLGTVAAEDGRAIEGEVKALGEGQARICQEADLKQSVYSNVKNGRDDLRRWSLWGPRSCPMLSCYVKLASVRFPSAADRGDTTDETCASMVTQHWPRSGLMLHVPVTFASI